MNRPFCDSESAGENSFLGSPRSPSARQSALHQQAGGPRRLHDACRGRRKRNSARRGKRKTMHMVKFLRARFLLCSFPDIDEYNCKAFDTVSRPKYHMTDSRCLLSLILHQNRQNIGIVSYGSFSFYRLGMRNCLACKTICFPASGMYRPLPQPSRLGSPAARRNALHQQAGGLRGLHDICKRIAAIAERKRNIACRDKRKIAHMAKLRRV